MNEAQVRLSVGEQAFDFVVTPLAFRRGLSKDVFARENNKTVRETLRHPKYLALGPESSPSTPTPSTRNWASSS